eukprot:1154498-Pleurochrysis_carterae.AAC.1
MTNTSRAASCFVDAAYARACLDLRPPICYENQEQHKQLVSRSSRPDLLPTIPETEANLVVTTSTRYCRAPREHALRPPVWYPARRVATCENILRAELGGDSCDVVRVEGVRKRARHRVVRQRVRRVRGEGSGAVGEQIRRDEEGGGAATERQRQLQRGQKPAKRQRRRRS